MGRRLACAVTAASLALCAPAAAKSLFFTSEASAATQSTGVFAPRDSIVLVGLIPLQGSNLAHKVSFVAQAPNLSAKINWVVGDNAAALIRTVGVNVDLLDATGMVVASDTFTGIAGGTATSTMTAALTPGARYILSLTGTTAAVSTFTVAVEFR